MAQRLTVEIVGDASRLNRTFRETSRDAKRFEATMTRTGRSFTKSFAGGAAGFFSARGLVAGLESSVAAASNLQQMMSKTTQVFGDSSQDVKTWSQTTTQAFGISRREALATASSFGALFAPMGLVGAKAAEQSEKLVELGADLASFYDTDVTDALDALRSGIVGESEPLRRYGVLLSETRVQAKALADTHKQSAQDLTAAEKAAARIALIFRDASKASGDFARTSEDLANKSKTLRAQLDDLQANFGGPYLEGLATVAGKANDALKALGLAADTNIGPTLQQQADLVPKLAREYGRLRDNGYSAADAVKQLKFDLAAKGIKDSALIIGDAINYFAGGPTLTKIVRLRQEIYGLSTDADTAAKSFHGLAAAAAQAATAAPRGLAALTPGVRAGLQLAQAGLTTGTGDDLAALTRQHELNVRAAQFARNRLAGATGPAAARWAANLQRVLEDDASVLDRIRGIQADNAQKIKDAAARQREANRRAAELAAEVARNRLERQRGWLDFAAERAGATKTISDDVKAYRALERWLKERIRQEGRTLELVRDLWQTRQRIRDLNKSKADVDPLAGLIQVSSGRLAAMLSAGTGLGAHGQRILSANVSALEIQSYVHIDGREVGRAVNRDQARTSRRTARQTSGYRG